MQQVSSNLTLFVKFFIPVFWVVFFGAFTIAVLASKNPYFGNIPSFLYKVGVSLFYLLGLVILYRLLFRMKRVEMDDQAVMVTNYFKTFKYAWSDIEKIRTWGFGLLLIGRIQLKGAGTFGRKMPFLASKKRLSEFIAAHPAKAEYFEA